MPGASTATTRLVDGYDAVLLDLDGVVYVGQHAVPGAVAVINILQAEGIPIRYLTNNASRPPRVVGDHLRGLGIGADDDDVVTSAQAAADLVAARVPPGSAVLVVGGDGLVEALRLRGLVPVSTFDDDPAAVVQGFAPGVDWRLLHEGVRAVRAGLPWIACNLDRTIPTATGTGPGNGLLVDVVRQVTGIEPLVAGKPERPLVDKAVATAGAKRPILVGDRLDTDVAAARAYGCDSLFVLSGVHTRLDALALAPEHRPTFVGDDLRALLHPPTVLAPVPLDRSGDAG